MPRRIDYFLSLSSRSSVPADALKSGRKAYSSNV
jgi:hypothetical protein